MKLKNFKHTFKKIRRCASALFDQTNDRVQFIFDYLNNDFKKTYAYQTINFARDEYEYLCSDISHIWDNLHIR